VRIGTNGATLVTGKDYNVSNTSILMVRAVRTVQAGAEIYMFALPANRILEIAEISRVKRDAAGELEGYQRGEIKSHVADIARYLEGGDVLFPNPIILAIAPGVHFQAVRGPSPGIDGSTAGTLHLPAVAGARLAWIVDGQQRAMALDRTASELMVPIVAFASADIAVHREQFVLVNKARPLPRGVVDVLLPTLDAALLPRDLGPRRLPNVLVDSLNSHRDSPFYRMIKRVGDDNSNAVIGDQALLKAIKRSIRNPLGALSPYAPAGSSPDVGSMYALLSGFWGAARETFPDAWGLPPNESRLMHSAGIEALSYLMDRVLARPESIADPRGAARDALLRIAPDCRWTAGRWEALGLEWNEVEYTTKLVARLRDHLIRLEHRPRIAA
jgi:DGQHR domain-containing protein